MRTLAGTTATAAPHSYLPLPAQQQKLKVRAPAASAEPVEALSARHGAHLRIPSGLATPRARELLAVTETNCATGFE